MSDANGSRERVAKWLRLHLASGVGARTFAKLLEHLGGIDQALGATAGQLASVPGIGRRTAEQIARSRDAADAAGELALADQLGVRVITKEDREYPLLLSRIDDPPPVLYVKGTLERSDELAVAVVGSRNCSLYGQEQASRLSHLLAAAGFTIVSGLARGIDTAAHRGALSASGRTIAVQGCGLAQAYPLENAELAEQIAESGALLSEFPLRYEPLPTTFPMRNRIISGLALGTLVVEARPRSGALITAHLALEQGRDVFALPGRIDAPGSFGPHQLIKDGAKLVERIEDILEALGLVGEVIGPHACRAAETAQKQQEAALFSPPALKLSDTEAAVIACLDDEPLHVDEIIERSALLAGKVNATLTNLQLKGLVRQLPGSYYQKRSSHSI